MSANLCVLLGALGNALGVILGAFGAHYFKPYLGTQDFITYETAIRYFHIHAMALIVVGLAGLFPKTHKLNLAAWFFMGGIFFFCGSLFLLIATKIRFFGALTPLGGLCFILGWITFAWNAGSNFKRHN